MFIGLTPVCVVAAGVSLNMLLRLQDFALLAGTVALFARSGAVMPAAPRIEDTGKLDTPGARREGAS